MRKPQSLAMDSATVLRFDGFELDLAAGQLRREGRPVPLRPRPFALLAVFAQNPGRVLRKEELLDIAWAGVVVEENNLQVQVSVLRKLLGASAIATVAGFGYRFDRKVGDLPAAATPAHTEPRLVGRSEDIDQALALLHRARVTTITGTGGIGKTSLAREVARLAEPSFSDGTAWVDLAACTEPAIVPVHALRAIAPDLAAGRDPFDALLAFVKTRHVLVVLDNAEHVIDGVAAFAHRLVEQASGLRLLVTSQAPLRIAHEEQLRLRPLPPGDAVELFARRARANGQRFTLDTETTPVAAEICRRLDGIPLALELAAARVASFGLRGVERLLDERFRVLTSGARDAPARQQTLHAVYEWTYSLLTAPEQALFRRLGVLAAPLALQPLVELVGPVDADPYDTIASLVERSLLEMDDGDPPRYRMLESARSFAIQRLAHAREWAPLARAVRWYEAAGDAQAQAAAGAGALAAYTTALELLARTPQNAQRDAGELQLLLKLGPAVQATLGPSHERCEAIYRRSVELARRGVPSERAFQAIWGYWHFLSLAGRDSDAAPYAREIVKMGTQLPDDGLQLEALHAEMTTCDLLGDARGVVAHARRITGMYDRCRHHRLTFAFGGHDPGVCALGQAAVNLWLTGQDDEARSSAREALALAAHIEHGYSRATAAFYAAIAFASLGDKEDFARTAHSLADLSDQYGMEMLLNEGRFFVARARHDAGDTQGLAAMQDALARIEGSGDLAFVFVYMALLADAMLARGDYAGIEELAARAVSHARHGQRLFLPEVLRLRAEAMARRGDPAWQQVLADAETMAEGQGATALLARIRSRSFRP